jgi:hypothetical protein
MTATATVFLVPRPKLGNIGDVTPEILNDALQRTRQISAAPAWKGND